MIENGHDKAAVGAGKSAKKSAGLVGTPFKPGPDSRRGRGPKKGAPNAGRPPNELRAMLREAGAKIAIPRLAQISAQGKDADAVRASAVILEKALPNQAEREAEVEYVRWVVVLPKKAKTTEEWLRMHNLGRA